MNVFKLIWQLDLMWRVCIHAMKLGPLWGGLDSINTEVLGLGVWGDGHEAPSSPGF